MAIIRTDKEIIELLKVKNDALKEGFEALIDTLEEVSIHEFKEKKKLFVNTRQFIQNMKHIGNWYFSVVLNVRCAII